MRVNVYDHDLTGRVELVDKTTKEGARFVGVCFYLGPKIQHTEKDDDTAGVTFFFHEDATYERGLLVDSLAKALRLLGVDELPEVAEV